MEPYNQRAVRFFFQSISTLKKESGAQRWNEICKDAAILWEETYPQELRPLFLSNEELWELLFEPPEDIRHPLYMKFEILCAKPLFITFFFRILQALLDPPTAWWQSQFT